MMNLSSTLRLIMTWDAYSVHMPVLQDTLLTGSLRTLARDMQKVSYRLPFNRIIDSHGIASSSSHGHRLSLYAPANAGQ